MEPELRRAFEEELEFLQQLGGEFVEGHEKTGWRLDRKKGGLEFHDPHVKMLLEGVAFLTANLRRQIAAEFPAFTEQLLQIIYPHYLAPTPSQAVVQFEPDLAQKGLANGFEVPPETPLVTRRRKGVSGARCEYRTKARVVLWPLSLVDASYCKYLPGLALAETKPSFGVSLSDRARAGIRLRLRAGGGSRCRDLALDRLSFFLRGSWDLRARLYEQIVGRGVQVVLRPSDGSWKEVIAASHIRAVGFEDNDALLPYTARSFHGFRLLHEYFAFPERFLFFELSGLEAAVRRCAGEDLELILLVDREDETLEARVDASQFALFCVPAINLFPARSRFYVDPRRPEHRVPMRSSSAISPEEEAKAGDRASRATDLEIHSIREVRAHERKEDPGRVFSTLFATASGTAAPVGGAFYTARRQPRKKSRRELERGWRNHRYRGGSDVYLQLVDTEAPPHSEEIRELTVSALCTNRDLPFDILEGGAGKAFDRISNVVRSIQCVAGPTAPVPAPSPGSLSWRLIRHLSLNYLSLEEGGDGIEDGGDRKKTGSRGARLLEDLLGLYRFCAASKASEDEVGVRGLEIQGQSKGVISLVSHSKIEPLPIERQLVFGPVLTNEVTLDEDAFRDSGGVFLFGMVVAEFLRRYASINYFTRTRIKTREREVQVWFPMKGRRPSS